MTQSLENIEKDKYQQLNERLEKLSIKINELEKRSSERYLFAYDTLIRGNAKLSTDINISKEIIDKMKTDLKRYEFISAAWVVWWLIHLINKLMIVAGM